MDAAESGESVDCKPAAAVVADEARNSMAMKATPAGWFQARRSPVTAERLGAARPNPAECQATAGIELLLPRRGTRGSKEHRMANPPPC